MIKCISEIAYLLMYIILLLAMFSAQSNKNYGEASYFLGLILFARIWDIERILEKKEMPHE